MFSLIYAWINDWVNNHEAGDLRRQHGHYDVIVMSSWLCKVSSVNGVLVDIGVCLTLNLECTVSVPRQQKCNGIRGYEFRALYTLLALCMSQSPIWWSYVMHRKLAIKGLTFSLWCLVAIDDVMPWTRLWHRWHCEGPQKGPQKWTFDDIFVLAWSGCWITSRIADYFNAMRMPYVTLFEWKSHTPSKLAYLWSVALPHGR